MTERLHPPASSSDSGSREASLGDPGERPALAEDVGTLAMPCPARAPTFQKESAGCCFEICQSGSRTLSSETELNKMFCVIKEEIKF